MKRNKLLILVLVLLCVTCVIFASCKKHHEQDSNAIVGLNDVTLTCGQSLPRINASAEYGTVALSIAKSVDNVAKENLSYGAIDYSKPMTEGVYFVKAYVSATEQYTDATAYATVTVNHQNYDSISKVERTVQPVAEGAVKGYSVKKCACGEELRGDYTVIATIKLDGVTVDTQIIAVGGKVAKPSNDKFPSRQGYAGTVTKGGTEWTAGETVNDFTTIELSSRWIARSESANNVIVNPATAWIFMTAEEIDNPAREGKESRLTSGENGYVVSTLFDSNFPASPAEVLLGDVELKKNHVYSFTVKSTQGTFIWFGSDFEHKAYEIADASANTPIIVTVVYDGNSVDVTYNGTTKFTYSSSEWSKANLNGLPFKIQDKNPENETLFEHSGTRYELTIGKVTDMYDYMADVNDLLADLPADVDGVNENNAELITETANKYQTIVDGFMSDYEKAKARDITDIVQAATAIANDHNVALRKLAEQLPDIETMATANEDEKEQAYNILAKYLAYFNVKMTDDEKQAYKEPAKISFYREYFKTRTYVLNNVSGGIETSFNAWIGGNVAGAFNPNNQSGDITLPKIPFGAYDSVTFVIASAAAEAGELKATFGDYTVSVNSDTLFMQLTVSKKDDGWYLTIANSSDGYSTSHEIKLSDAVILGNEGIKFTYSNTCWGWVAVSASGNTNTGANRIDGTLTTHGAATVYTVTYNYKTNAGDKQYVQYYLQNSDLTVYLDGTGSYSDEIATYTFDGFFAEGSDAAVKNGDKVNSNLVLTARYKVNEGDYKEYEVIFYDANDDEIESATKMYRYDEALVLPADPSKTSSVQGKYYQFVGWFDPDNNQWRAGDKVHGPLDLTPKFELKDYVYTVAFKNGEATVSVRDDLKYGDAIVAPADPTKAATIESVFTFKGWFLANEQGEATETELTDGTNVTGNAVYVAVFNSSARKYAVTFVNYDNTELAVYDVAYGDTPEYKGETPVKTDENRVWIFDGWAPAIHAVNGEQTYTAQFKTDGVKVEFYVDGTLAFTDYPTVGNVPAYNVGGQNAPAKAPTVDKVFEFVGWALTENGSVTALTAVTEADKENGVKYYAVFTESARTYKVEFLNDDGTTAQSQTLAYGADITAPQSPSKDATYKYTYTFDGWFVKDNDGNYTTQFADGSKVQGEVTYHAKFSQTIRSYTVTFLNADVDALTVDADALATEPIAPVRDGYKFDGWTLNGSKYDFATPVKSDVQLVARWLVYGGLGDKQTIYTAEQLASLLSGTMENRGGAESTSDTWWQDSDETLYTQRIRVGESSDGVKTFILPAFNYNDYDAIHFIIQTGTETANWSISVLVNGQSEYLFEKATADCLQVRIVKINGQWVCQSYVIGDPVVKQSVAISQDVVEGKEGLTFSFWCTANTWVKMSEIKAIPRLTVDYIEQANTVAAQIDGLADSATDDEKINILTSYMKARLCFTDYEQSVNPESNGVKALKEYLNGLGSRTIVDNAYDQIVTDMPDWEGQANKFNPSGQSYSVELPKIVFGMYDSITMVMKCDSGTANWTATCGNATVSKQGTLWLMFTVSKHDDGHYYVNMCNADDGVGGEIMLSDAVVRGEEGISFTLATDDWGWCWLGTASTDNTITATIAK